MLSVYFHALFGDPSWAPPQFRPIPFRDAVEVLARDDGPFATARRRRAIAKVYASPHRRLLLHEAGPLDVPLGELEQEFHLFDAGDTPREEPPMETIVSFLEREIPPAPEECTRTFPKTHVSFDVFSGRSDAELELSVTRDFEAMRAALDPQHWSQCAPKYWVASYACADPGNARVDWKAGLPRLANPPRPGSSWNGAFFEHVRIDYGPADVQFWVVLDVASKPSALAHEFTYELRRPGRSALGPIEVEGGLDLDEGEIRATAAARTGPTQVFGSKAFKLRGLGPPPTDFFANLWASISLQQMADEAYEGVCCKP
jgi:hypothetical protein